MGGQAGLARHAGLAGQICFFWGAPLPPAPLARILMAPEAPQKVENTSFVNVIEESATIGPELDSSPNPPILSDRNLKPRG